MKNSVTIVIGLALALVGIANDLAAAQPQVPDMLPTLGLPKLGGQIAAYHSDGAKPRAQKLQTAVADMVAFYEKELGIHVAVTLAILDAGDWAKVQDAGPYGLPFLAGTPPAIFLPATSGGLAFQFMLGRKEAIPPELLRSYLESGQTTFETAADEFVDVIGFHELGHALCTAGRIDPKCLWLHEYVASCFAYAFVAERRPESRKVFDLLGRPTKARPKNTTLADFERLYTGVDDYGWYQGMFESHVQKLYSRMGLRFLKELRQRFPEVGTKDNRGPVPVTPEQVLADLEKFAPGFQNWARAFQD